MFRKKDLKSGVFGIIVLVIGIIVGVMLVKQTQVFKNKAMEQAGKMYTVCHKTGDPKQPWKELKVTADSLPLYLNNGDIYGECR